MEAGIREVKAHLSAYIRKVRDGEVVTITDRGSVAALLVPPHWLSNLDRGVAEGWIVPPRRRGPMPRIQRFAASTSVAEILREDRDGDNEEER
jgi:prevent-host-death family protein